MLSIYYIDLVTEHFWEKVENHGTIFFGTPSSENHLIILMLIVSILLCRSASKNQEKEKQQIYKIVHEYQRLVKDICYNHRGILF